MIEKVCPNCNKTFSSRLVFCSTACSKNRKYSQATKALIIDLWHKDKTNAEIATELDISMSTVKRTLASANLVRGSELAQKHAQAKKLAKNPNHMADMRKHLTPEARKRQSLTITETFKNPKYHQIFSDRSKKMWQNMPQDVKDEMIEHRAHLMRETKLGMTSQEFHEIMLEIKNELENERGSATSWCYAKQLDPNTVTRYFHKMGWSDLIQEKTTTGHREVYEYIRSLGIEGIEFNNRTIIPPKELDLWLPKYRLGIEYNGLFWHSEMNADHKPLSHRQKYLECVKKDVNLLAIFEDEWKNWKKRRILQAMIRHRLGLYHQKFRASKLELKLITDKNIVNNFFEDYHLDGSTSFHTAYGLYFRDELVCCISLRKPYTSINKDYTEIARFAIKDDVKIYGALGKFLKVIKGNVLSYSNNRIGHGNVYKQNGFKESTITMKPSYWYTDLKTRVWRFACRRNNNPEILAKYPTEKSQARNGIFAKQFGHSGPVYKIYDYGSRRWVLER